jgi:hypothetical protein
VKCSSWPTRVRRLLALARVPSLLLLGACASDKRGQASKLVLAIDAYRRAPLIASSQSVMDLSALECDPDTSCVAKRACERSSTPSRRAVTLMDELGYALRANIDDSGGASAFSASERARLEALATEAQAAFAAGKNALEACDHEVLALRRLYNLPPRAF